MPVTTRQGPSTNDGKKTKTRERFDERYDLRLTSKMKETLQGIAIEEDSDISDVIRNAVTHYLEDQQPPSIDMPSMSALLAEAAQSGELQEALSSGGLRLPVLGSAPCGPIRDVIQEVNAHHFLSPTTVEWLDASARDVFIICDGESMEGAGIPNGALLMMRLLPQGGRPQAGDVALVQFRHSDGSYNSTVKRWMKSSPLVLHDGDGNPIELPTDLQEAIPVAVARGIVSRYK